jgi:uncharacterized LabA/DUF88 family protein
MSSRGRTIMYVDNSNMFKSLKQLGWKIDAHKLFSKLEEQGDIWQTHFFAAVTDPPRYKQTNFYRILKEDLHWETYIFPLGYKTRRCSKCGTSWQSYAEKGVDVALATRLLTHASVRAFDTSIILSGDKDYLETVKSVKNLGMRVEIVGFHRSMSQQLAVESSVSVVYLYDIRSEIELITPTPEDREIEDLIPDDE